MEAVIADLGKLREQIKNMKTMQQLVVDLAHTKSQLSEPLAPAKFRGLAETYLVESQMIKSADYLTSLDHEEASISAAHEKATLSKNKMSSAVDIYRKLTGLDIKLGQQEVDKDMDVVTRHYYVSVEPPGHRVTLQGRGEVSELGHRIICGAQQYDLDTPDGVEAWHTQMHAASAVRHKI